MSKDIDPQNEANEVFGLIKWNEQGLAPVITQQHDTGEVLMLAWADRDAVAHTLQSAKATYFSRSRGGQWIKGETSGHTQRVVEVRVDCDGDAVLYRVDSPGPACHQFRRSCFSHVVNSDGSVNTDRPVIA